jgi:hypothetical protein
MEELEMTTEEQQQEPQTEETERVMRTSFPDAEQTELSFNV